MDAHAAGGLWLLREMWGFPQGVPEDQRLEYLRTIMACARGDGVLSPTEKSWVIGYGAACGAHQATVDALEAYDGNEDPIAILERNMPIAKSWGRVAIFDAIRAASADHDYADAERATIRRVARKLDIDDATVTAIEDVFRREQELKSHRIAVMFGEQIPY